MITLAGIVEGLLLAACVGVTVVATDGVLVPRTVAVAAGVVGFVAVAAGVAVPFAVAVAVAVVVGVGVGTEEGGPLEGSLVGGSLLSRVLISLTSGTVENCVMVTMVTLFGGTKGTSSKLTLTPAYFCCNVFWMVV